MAETVVGALRYDFKADTSGLKSGLADVSNSIKGVNDQLKQNNVVFAEFGKKAQQSVGLARHEMINLSRQINDVGVSLAGGMSPLMVLIQQGGQIADIFSGSQASVGSALRSMLFNAKAASLGIVAGLGTIAAAAYSSEMALEKLSDSAKALGTNRSSLREFSRQADILGVDPKTLRDDMVSLAQKIREAQIAGGDFADKLKLIGININNFDLSKPGEFARLFQLIAEKVRTGSNELDKLNALKFLGLSAEFSRVFNEGGDAVRKFADDSVGAVEDSSKPIEEKWRELRTIASNTWKAIADTAIDAVYAIKENVTSIIDAIANAFARFSVQIDKLMAKAKYSYEYAKSFVGGQSPDTNAYNEKMADYNRMSGYLNMPKGAKETSLPQIDVGGTTDLSALSTAKAKSGGSKGNKTDQLKEYIDNLKEANQLAKNEVDTFSLGNIEKEKFSALIKAENIAKEQGKVLSASQRAEIEQTAVSTQNYKQQVEQLKNTQSALNDAMRQFADFSINAIEDLVTRSRKLSDVLKDVVKQLSTAALKGVLTGDGIFGKLSGLASNDGSMGGLLGKALSFLPKFADGGTLGAGKWGIAGEAGPELIQGPANITPMGKGSSPQITINNYSNSQVDARQMSDGQIIVTVQQMINSGLKRVPNIMAEAQRRSL
ncbi:prophage tail length tape measure protein [Caudoviricetes sp.]|nr:prophage tail length tape measure protein [Caudoviricetes sp.]UOF81483.1 prophage tail length tape measure protein [Caudoviricetes sp.]